jgi:hypothetical protein
MTPEEAMNEARALGIEEDRAASDMFQSAAPTGRFSEGALNSLVDAFNEVLVTMGIPDPYPQFTSGARVLPGDFVKGLAMVADATTQLGMSNPVNLDGVEDDTDLELMAGKLMNLAENEEFAVKMNEVPGEDGSDIMPDGEAVEDDDELGILEEDDALFMQRM